MAPKAVLGLISLLLVAILLISSDAATAEQQQHLTKDDVAAAGDAVGDNKQVHGCARGCCGWFRGRCIRCCHATETADVVDAGDAVGDNKQVHGCRHGCCGWFRGRCVRCCRASETIDAAGAEIVGDNKQRFCRCCRFVGRRCVRRCCPNGEEYTLDEEATAEPQN